MDLECFVEVLRYIPILSLRIHLVITPQYCSKLCREYNGHTNLCFLSRLGATGYPKKRLVVLVPPSFSGRQFWVLLDFFRSYGNIDSSMVLVNISLECCILFLVLSCMSLIFLCLLLFYKC